MEAVTLSRQKRDHIVWTDLVFRVPPHRPETKVLKKEARSHTSTAATSDLRPRGSDCQPDKKDRQRKLLHHCMDSVQDEEAEESSPPPPHTMNAPSCPVNLALQEKHKVKRILVDLRPILENVTDLSEKGSEERGLQNEARCSSDLGDSRRKDLVSSEEADEEDPTNDELPPSNARELSSDEHETEATTTDSEDGEANQDILLPLPVDPGRELSPTAKAPKGICSPPGETMPLWRINLPAAQPSQPVLTTPTLSSKITPQLQDLPVMDSTTVIVRPTAPSPDFQLPTQLLLQRLQETTTSKNHLLIMQVLRSLREELLAESSDPDDRIIPLSRTSPSQKTPAVIQSWNVEACDGGRSSYHFRKWLNRQDEKKRQQRKALACPTYGRRWRCIYHGPPPSLHPTQHPKELHVTSSPENKI